MRKEWIIVDGHAHTFQSDEIASKIIYAFNDAYNIQFNNPGTGTIQDILHKMEDTGIDYTVMANFAPPKIIHQNNLWSINVSKQNPGLVPLISLHPGMEEGLCEVLEQYIIAGAKGVKIHPMAQGIRPDDRKLKEAYAYCSTVSFPVVFHCGRVANARLNEYADLDMILPMVEEYPEVPFVLTHMADGNIEDVVRVADNFQNVYFDTSIVISGYGPILASNEPSWTDDGVVADVVCAIGAHRMMFGSDYPWGSPAHDLERFLKMDLEDAQKCLILGGNALSLFKVKEGFV